MGDVPLSVTQLLQKVRARVRGPVSVVGEISAFSSARGRWRLTLMTGNDKLHVIFWEGTLQRHGYTRTPEVGHVVCVFGTMDIYAAAGQFQLVGETISPVGMGDRQRRYEALKAEYTKRGLFDVQRPLPRAPRFVGVATSRNAAALQDVKKVLHARWPLATLLHVHCQVQGPQAAASISDAMRTLQEDGRAEVILLVRGGGSPDDLWVFNEPPVVEAVAQCSVPVVTGVGHQTDYHLCDAAADRSAATPSAAAEAAVPEIQGLKRRLGQAEAGLARAIREQLRWRRDRLKAASLRHPRQSLTEHRRRVQALEKSLTQAARQGAERRRARLVAAAGKLDAISPLKVLERGYAVATHEGRAVTDADTLQVGDRLELRLHRGRRTVEVIE